MKKNNSFSKIELVVCDNISMQMLCGELNENLSYLKQKFDINITNIGNILYLEGNISNITEAQEFIEYILKQLPFKNNLTTEELQTFLLNDKKSYNNITNKITTKQTTIFAKNEAQNAYIKMLETSAILFAIGPAGTGKTYLAVAYAIQALEKGLFDKIILCRPAVESGEKLGFLPGDMKDKIDPYLQPLYDALYDMLTVKKTSQLIENKIIEIAPLAFMRGRSFNNALIILDEAQNTSTAQMKMFLTRLGEGSKMVIAGDVSQVDLPKGQLSGLREALHILKNIPQIKTIFFNETDVVRHPLVSAIIKAYNNYEH